MSATISRFPSPVLDPRKLVLATDLDGTLLAGSGDARRQVRELFSGGLEGATLVFVTGRGLESVMPLLSDPTIPTPHYIIADVGSTIVRGRDLRPVEPLHHETAANWPGSHAVVKALAGFPGLQRQSVPQERRCSFLSSEAGVTPALRAAVESLGCDLLFSAGRYLDVLPRGVCKGSALRRLADAAGFDHSQVVVAGDTLNDLSLFEAGFKGIAVGGSEPALVARVRRMKHAYIADGEGCDGILEGLAHHGLTLADTDAAAEPTRGKAGLVMVYHRLPYDEAVENGVSVRRRPKSPNGIMPTLLSLFADGRTGSWVAWSQQDSRTPAGFVTHEAVDAERYPNLEAARIALTGEDVDLFYKKFSKEAFWPIIFSFPDKAEFRQDHWERFLEVNRLFAEQTAREAQDGATAWIHDYNLWMVPAFLRPLRPDLKIAFFHHTAFPSSDVFNILPWRREILASLLQCDYIGFHIPRYAENFVDAARAFAPLEVLERAQCAPRFLTYGCALGVDTVATTIEAGGRRIALGAHPVGTDVGSIERLLGTEAVASSLAEIDAYLDGRTGIVSIERLDYVKGSLEKLQAFERLLELHPELAGKVTLLNIITPAAPGMEVYEALREELDRTVGRINGRFSTLDWVPVRYFYRSLPFEAVLAHYAACGIAWITPLRDGLNLVAKEYIAARKAAGKAGVLILSEFAGAAVELHGALLTNPYDTHSMTSTLYRAITMRQDEAVYRTERLAAIVAEHDVARWGADFLDAVERAALEGDALAQAA
ncbi:glucosylglycerol-phosphate synthase [Massilia sp. WF1]|uniref:glucosylglycerol-phosphate synthase n=1 Tax=unclassified Massilia TaxID=2609279 RepID=UPI00064A0BC0|nr:MULTISPECIES: glucosylglycerol-phosphate synthase [unclassified Massilia]ALK95356.1 glucosylglycerol-phosphate synthase [Massilia sp. WG5]KLU35761.1 glucosylglycerol-phosphate synthase [Massilia sp. WF1]